MSAIAVTSAVNHRRIGRARTWLESRVVAEEVLIIGASLDAANELARKVAEEKGAAFGWHRVTLPQLAAELCLRSFAVLRDALSSFADTGEINRRERWATDPNFVFAGV